jgi:D-inositol-3-phosphate glycosyltransferase
VIPAGVDVAAFTPHGPRAPSGSGRPRILAVGQPGPSAGLEDTVAVLRLVPTAELVIIGGAPGEQPGTDLHARRLLAVADRAGVTDRVRLVGAVPPERMAEWYRSAAMLVATPRCPSFGLAAVEAMACGVPVVGYALGGLADSVVDGITGRLVRVGEVAGLATAVRQLLASGVDRLAYSEAAVDRARSRYAWNRIVAELELLYGDVAGVDMTHRTGPLGSLP